ncbi:MAG TPA: hypothetical protein PKE40_07135 [Arachnia sp.]|nr:hypothetical protein [Arachnia sp.]HMT86108.1 hypothetical protein [Arachnia sp.]
MKRLLTLVLAAVLLAIGAPPAQAAPRVTATSSLGSAIASPSGATTFSIKGSGFQSLKGGFGGIYLMFGWVSDPGGGSWRPSQGGKTGTDLLYVPDSESKDNRGYQKFVAFPGSSTEDTANGGVISADGTISLELVVPGPRFTAQDRDGNKKEVDCLSVQCGIITIGAHGVVNASNESFTPISFGATSSGSGGSSGTGTGGNAPAATTQSVDQAATATAESAVAVGDAPASLGLTQTSVQAGRVLGFTGQGFAPGEQVVATVGAGLAGAGPLTAGRFGEVAGAIQLPADMRAGTHKVILTAAGSGKRAETTVAVMADPTVVAGAAEPVHSEWWRWAAIAVGVVAVLLLVLIVSSLATAIGRRRRARKRAGGTTRSRRKRVRRKKEALA